MPPKKKSDADSTSAQSLRDARIFGMAAAGKTQSEIGQAVGLSRQSVGVILNSEDAKKLVEQAKSDIQALLGEAVATIQYALSRREEDTKTAAHAALTILKGCGALTEKVEHTVMKPFIVRMLDGTEIVMGHRSENEDESD